MPPYPSAISSLNADQAAAAGSLVRLLTSRFDTLPVGETNALAQTLLAQDGLVADIRNLLHTMSVWAGAVTAPDAEEAEARAQALRDHIPIAVTPTA
ncbi:hypothetical protein OG756_34080 [Streptomyces sp. NBC_01310]|uniref:hypothetical protein n=1 Tax=Streptomyces sp. NBC_01310 TaxID=2903820 RepID=UPI0035B5D761|nr:hypothetical protein OG756_34080 [Streptomyces sp. NBC_01310]